MILALSPDPRYRFYMGEDRPADELVVRESWVENVYQFEHGDLEDTGIVVDVGANIGAFSVLAASKAEDRSAESNQKKPIKVFAIEPEPHNFDFLKRNIEVNNFQKIIRPYQVAVWSKTGKTMKISDGAGGSQLGQPVGASVTTITLPDFFSQHKIKHCDVLKVDVEGSEYAIFEACSPDFLACIRYITMEFHSATQEAFGRLVAKLCLNHNVHVIGAPSRGGQIYARL